jgi:hypothetical protein
VYNLVQYLRANISGETIFANNIVRIGTSLPMRYLLVRESGSDIVPVSRFMLQTFQVLSADKDNTGSRSLSYLVYDLIKEKFGEVLPSVTVDSETFDSVKTTQITAIQLPFSLGENKETGLVEYTTNYSIYYSEVEN